MKTSPPAGDLIREAIASALQSGGISQAELSRRTGMTPVSVSRYLTGQRDVTTRQANRMLEALGIRLAPQGDAQ